MTVSGGASPKGEIGAGGTTALLRDLEKQQATGTIRFQIPVGSAEVQFLSGMIVEARMEELSGRGALFRLLEVNEGSFDVALGPVSADAAITPSLDHVLAQLTQWQKLSAQAPALSSVPELSSAGREALERRTLAEEQRALLALVDGKRALSEIIDESGVDAVDALTLLVGAVQGGMLRVHSSTTHQKKVEGAPPMATIPPPASAEAAPQAKPLSHYTSRSPTLMVGTPTAVASNNPLGVHRIVAIDSPPPPAPHGFQGPASTRPVIALHGSPIPAPLPAPVALHDPSPPPVRESSQLPNEPAPQPGRRPTPPSVGGPLPIPEPIEQRQGAKYIGRYEILCRIGRGGMGSVYLCRLSSQGGFRRLFALKLLRRHLLADSQAARRFLDEARLSGQIHHPNVVGVIDAGFHASQPYLVMDYIEGCSLKELLTARPNSRPPAPIVSIVLDALAGLHSAHTLVGEDGSPLEIVHCDVSPENLIVGIDGVCRITDFGVARHGDRTRDSNEVTHGKASYLAPERLSNGRLDCRADVFSIGIVLYQALTGVKLFEGANVQETLNFVRTRRIEPPSNVGLRPPPSLNSVCLRALEREPDRRFSSAQEMMLELRRIALRENLLAPTSEVAQWVKDAVEPDLRHRRAIVLEGAHRSAPPPTVSLAPPEPIESSLPPSAGPPSSSMPPPALVTRFAAPGMTGSSAPPPGGNSSAPPPNTDLIVVEAAPGWSADPSLSPNLQQGLCQQVLQHAGERGFVVGLSGPSNSVDLTARVASELALALSASGQARVLILEGNFQRPAVHRHLRISMPLSAGLSAQLNARSAGSAGKPWTVYRCSATLHALAEGPMRSPGLILSQAYYDCVTELRGRYDVLLIDGPAVTDAVELRAFDSVIDAVVLVAKNLDDVSAAERQFSQRVLSKVVV